MKVYNSCYKEWKDIKRIIKKVTILSVRARKNFSNKLSGTSEKQLRCQTVGMIQGCTSFQEIENPQYMYYTVIKTLKCPPYSYSCSI